MTKKEFIRTMLIWFPLSALAGAVIGTILGLLRMHFGI